MTSGFFFARTKNTMKKIGWNSLTCNNPMSLQLAALLLLEVSQSQMNYINLSNDSKSPGASNLQKSSSLLNLFQQILDSRGKLGVVGDATNSVGEDWKENHYMQTKTSKSLLTQLEILLIYICKSISPSTITNLFYQLYLHTLETAPWCAAVHILDVMVGRHGWMGVGGKSTGMMPQRWF